MLKTICCTSSIALLSLGLLACGGGGSSSDSNTGTLSVGVTDAPVDYAQNVLVQFTGLTVKRKGGEQEYLPLSGDSQTCAQLLNSEAPVPTPEGESTIRCIDLMTLQGTQSTSLLDGEILTAGEYEWMRLEVNAERDTMDSMIVMEDNNVYSLYVPSGSQSGLKLNQGYTILAGGSHDFMIDFDLRKSVNDPQGFADYRLTPSLRMIDLAESGNMTGTVEASLLTAEGCTGDINTDTGFAVYVYEGGEGTLTGDEGSANAPHTSAGVSYNGESGQYEYTVGYLAPGEYTALFTCQASNDSSEVADEAIAFVESPDSPTIVVADQDSVVNF